MTKNNDYVAGETDERPWGQWAVLASADGYAIKEIVVNPGEELSLQSHQHRAEFWIVLSGTATVTLGNEIKTRTSGQTVHIRAKMKHRVANTGDVPLRFIEVQTGAHLSENDIKRYQDRYGRSSL